MTTAYDRALAVMGGQLDESQKKKLQKAALQYNEANDAERRTANAERLTGIQSDTQLLAGQGLAGNAYSEFQSGAQERKVKTREGVFDLTQNSLASQESNSLVSYGNRLIAEKRYQDYLRRQELLKQQELQQSVNDTVFLQNWLGQATQLSQYQKKETDTKQPTSTWGASYNALAQTVGTGAQGMMNALAQNKPQYQATQRAVYGAVKQNTGVGEADTLFGLNPIKNDQELQQAKIAQGAIEVMQKKYAPLSKEDGTVMLSDIDKKIADVETAIADETLLGRYARDAETGAEISNKIAEYNDQLDALEEERRIAERRMKATVYADWMANMDNEDFAEKSKVQDSEDDAYYRGINGLSDKNDPSGLMKITRKNTAPAFDPEPANKNGYEYGEYIAKYMTDEEKEVYNYIYATQGAEKAKEYIEDIRRLLNARYAGEETSATIKMAQDAPILASAMSVFAILAKPMGYSYSIFHKGEIDPNSPYFAGSRVAQTVRSEVAQTISSGVGRLDRYSAAQLKKMGYSDADIARIESGEDLRTKGAQRLGAALGFLYQTGMSVGDFLLSSATGGPAALTLMAGGAASDTVMDAKLRGATDGQALTLGTIAGIAEVITEKFSLDHFYKMSVGGKLANVKNILAQMGIEASEEMASEVINIMADIAVMGDDGYAKLKVNAYMAAGMSESEAQMQVFEENLMQVLMAGLGGAISGGIIGGGKIATMKVISTVKNGVLDLTDPQTKKELSPEYQEEQRQKQDNATQDAVKRVQTIRMEDLKATDSNVVKATLIDVAVAELKSRGVSDAEVKQITDALKKLMSGEKLTAAERAKVVGNQIVRNAFNITEPLPRFKLNDAGTMEKAGEINPTQKTNVQPNIAEQTKTEVSPKSDAYKKYLSKSFVDTLSEQLNVTGEAGGIIKKDLQRAIVTAVESGNFDSDRQNILFEQISKNFPEGTNLERARIAFDDAVFAVRMGLALVDRNEAARYAKARSKAERAATAGDMKQVQKALEDRKPLARQLQQIKKDNLFTPADDTDIEYILKGGEVNLEGRTNAEQFKKRLDVEQKLRAANQIIQDYNKQRRKGLFDQALNAISGSYNWKDKRMGLSYSIETMERNVEDVVKDEAQAKLIIDTYFSPVHANEASSTRFKNDYRSRVEALNLNAEEKKAVQLLGEGSTPEMVEAQLGQKAFAQIDMEKAAKAADVFRAMYDELLTKANEALIRNGYDPIEYRKNYFPHFNDPEADTAMKKIAQALGISLTTKELPTDIAGLTAGRRPGKTWFGHLLERKGETTTIDAVKGFETYIEGVSDIVHHTDDIQRLRALESALRYEHSNEGMRKRMIDVMADTSYDPDKQQAELDALFSEKQGHLGKFVQELRDYTNLIANKKSIHDRSAEADIGRKMYEVVNSLNRRVAANMIAGNIGVALTNFIPLTQAWASTDTKYLIMGMTQTLASTFNDDGFSDLSDFLTNRKGSESIDLTKIMKIAQKASIPFTFIDNFVAESIVRAQTMQNMAKGMSQEDALAAANEWAGRIMADRSKGALPTYFKRSNPLARTFGMFQVEVNNQLRHLFKDLPRAMRDRSLAALAVALFKFCLGAWIYNEITEPIVGRRAALDPINIFGEFARDLAKKDMGTATFSQFVFEKLQSGEPWKMEDKDISTTTALENLWGNLMDQTPFVGTLLGGEGGRVPVSSALPDVWGIASDVIGAVQGDISWKTAGETAGKEMLKPVMYLALPFGGGQLKKTIEGIDTVAKGGSYKLDNAGEKRMQFATEQDLKTYLQAAIFGKWSLPTAQDYIRHNFDLMTVQETKGMKAARAAGVDDVDFMRIRARFRATEPTKDADGNIIVSAADKKREELMNWPGLTASQKQLIDKYLIAGEDSAPANYTTEALMKLSSMGEEEYRKALGMQNIGISPEKYLDYLELKGQYTAAASELIDNQTKNNFFGEMTGEEVKTLEAIPVNERLHTALWEDEDLTEKQRYQLEEALTGSDTWTKKAAQAARAGVNTDAFYNLMTKTRDYDGSEPSTYAWQQIRKDRSITNEQQLKEQDILAGTENQKKLDALYAIGIPKEPATRHLAAYRDIKASDDENPLGYSDALTVKLDIAADKTINTEQKMKLTDEILGTKLIQNSDKAKQEADISTKTWYSFYSKYWTLNAKDENGKTVSGLKKKRAKEYLQTLNLTQEQMEYLLFSTGDYEKW